MMYRYFTHNETYKYGSILQDLVSNYNNSPHTALGGHPPNDINSDNESRLWKYMYVDSLKRKQPRKVKVKQRRISKPYKLNLGDKVRISYLKYAFQRDYQHKFTEEVFKVNQRFRREGIPLYTLVDFSDDPIDGTFYGNELQKVTKSLDATWKIEKVLKKRIRNRKRELYVKWKGWPKKFNSWIPEADTQLLHPI